MNQSLREVLMATMLLMACTNAHAQQSIEAEPAVSAPGPPAQMEKSENKSEAGDGAKTDAQSPIAADAQASVVDSVKVSERPFYHGPGIFAVAGLVGGLIAAHAGKDEPDRIAGFVKREGIDIGAIVKAEVERQVAQKPELKLAYEKKGPAKFQIQILYGITSVPFSEYRPYLAVRMKLVDAGGVEKWAGRNYVGGHGKAPSIPYSDFYKSAKVFVDEFEVAASEVVSLIFNDFQK